MHTDTGGLPEAATVNRSLVSTRHLVLFAAISLAYVVSRYGSLGRELTFEEGFFLAPGFEFFHSGHYRNLSMTLRHLPA